MNSERLQTRYDQLIDHLSGGADHAIRPGFLSIRVCSLHPPVPPALHLKPAERIILRTQTGLDKTPCINRTLAVHDRKMTGCGLRVLLKWRASKVPRTSRSLPLYQQTQKRFSSLIPALLCCSAGRIRLIGSRGGRILERETPAGRGFSSKYRITRRTVRATTPALIPGCPIATQRQTMGKFTLELR